MSDQQAKKAYVPPSVEDISASLDTEKAIPSIAEDISCFPCAPS